MKELLIKLLIVLLLLPNCNKSEISQLDLKGTIKGKIIALDEFGNQSNDNSKILIQLEGSEPLISTLTDSIGKYEINDVPSGTYNLTCSKEGFGISQRQGVQIVGGNEPLYFSGSIIEKSSTTIEGLSLEIVNSTEIFLKGIVYHNYIIDEWSYRIPSIRFFLHNTNNPSDDNYLQTMSISFKGETGSKLESQIFINKSFFPSGSTIYIIAYGCYENEYGYYDILSNKYKYSSLGAASNIASIVVPKY